MRHAVLLFSLLSTLVLTHCGAGSGSVNAASQGTAPVITQQPADQTVMLGHAALFSVAAGGTPNLSYQWQKNGSAIPGATSASYATPPTTANDSGARFSVVVSNSVGLAASAAATLTISNQLALRAGFGRGLPPILDFGSVTVGASRAQVLTFTNADNVPLTLSGVVLPGPFAGTVPSPLVLMPGQSSSAIVTFTPAGFGREWGNLIIEGDSVVQVLLGGVGTASHFATVAWNDEPEASWYNVYRGAKTGGPYRQINSEPVLDTQFTDPNIQPGNVYFYTVTAVANGLESTYSDELQALVPQSPLDQSVIVGQPADQTVSLGGTATFAVLTRGAGLTYQWLRNGLVIPGATSATYAAADGADGDQFVVMVNTGAGIVTSLPATLMVTGSPSSP